MENDMRKALDWMQRDVERQARENRAVRETLARTIHDITDIVADFVDKETASVLVYTAALATGVSPERDNNAPLLQLAPDKVDELVGLWDDALVSWRERNLAEKQTLTGEFTRFEEECLARMKASEVSHRLKEERLVLEANLQQMVFEDHTSSLRQQLESANCIVEILQVQIANLSSQLTDAAVTNVQIASSDVATETEGSGEKLRTQLLDLAAGAESPELRAVHCNVELTEQVQRANELETRLLMLLEECEAQNHQQGPTPKSGIPSETVNTYHQKLQLLECRMQDVLQQVACDHEQFEYDQAKWALEKRHHREKYDEVLDASVKVLKVLIIREKLMKKNERAHKRVIHEFQEKQFELACQAVTLQGITTELMQQSAMVLLVLQQLAVMKSNPSQPHDTCSTWTLPAKPVQMKSMIKRLKKIESSLSRREWTSFSPTTALKSRKENT
ncbi:uncharacterized protein PITG_01129 [Phytophthora infestans T30-4]|uniref:Uncharacterized protein n=2 Tax=Phytophthora infestans TaxID=4787 RepID=D0MSJ2_PHYIT|nr:uncharacterized protein PITG_01129 [Phytophthora infestans T30-4]EEY58461.1 conserved hypothetical protein [Phytophthora infestans T30-4]|eukprot:XP_002909647.1 conserved hypothetical protein [Phytophthora infestans T30-4]